MDSDFQISKNGLQLKLKLHHPVMIALKAMNFKLEPVLLRIRWDFGHFPGVGGGGYFRNFWVGMCHWDPGNLNLYQS